jgi:hypothetical protein
MARVMARTTARARAQTMARAWVRARTTAMARGADDGEGEVGRAAWRSACGADPAFEKRKKRRRYEYM